MASIQKLARKKVDPVTGKVTCKTSHRVFIRITGLKPITKLSPRNDWRRPILLASKVITKRRLLQGEKHQHC